MLFGKALPLALGMAANICHALPNDVTPRDVAAVGLEPRDKYNYHFYAYPCKDCKCDPVYTVNNFGCERLCRIMSQPIQSVGLKKDSMWDPLYPTAELHSGLGCGGVQQNCGIRTLQTWGCTNVNIDNRALGIQLWYGCH